LRRNTETSGAFGQQLKREPVCFARTAIETGAEVLVAPVESVASAAIRKFPTAALLQAYE